MHQLDTLSMKHRADSKLVTSYIYIYYHLLFEADDDEVVLLTAEGAI